MMMMIITMILMMSSVMCDISVDLQDDDDDNQDADVTIDGDTVDLHDDDDNGKGDGDTAVNLFKSLHHRVLAAGVEHPLLDGGGEAGHRVDEDVALEVVALVGVFEAEQVVPGHVVFTGDYDGDKIWMLYRHLH